MRRPRTLTAKSGGHRLGATSTITKTFARCDFLKRVRQLNNGICTPTLSAGDAIISNRLHRTPMPFDRWKKLTDFRLLGVPKSAASGLQRFLHATAFAAFAKRHSPLNFMER